MRGAPFPALNSSVILTSRAVSVDQQAEPSWVASSAHGSPSPVLSDGAPTFAVRKIYRLPPENH